MEEEYHQPTAATLEVPEPLSAGTLKKRVLMEIPLALAEDKTMLSKRKCTANPKLKKKSLNYSRTLAKWLQQKRKETNTTSLESSFLLN